MEKRGKKPYVNAAYVPIEVLADTDNVDFAIGRIKSLIKMGFVEIVFYTHSIGLSRANVMSAVRTFIQDELVLSHVHAVSTPPFYTAENKTVFDYTSFKAVPIPPEVFKARIASIKASLAEKQK